MLSLSWFLYLLKIPHYQSATAFAKKKSTNEINVQIASILICEWNPHCVHVQYLHGCTFHALWRCLYLSGLFSVFLWWLRADRLFWNLDKHISLLKILTCNSSLCSFNCTYCDVVNSIRHSGWKHVVFSCHYITRRLLLVALWGCM